MHRNNKQWKMKWGQNLLSLKCQRSLPVGFGGSKTAGRDQIVADTWHSLTVLFGSGEEGNRLSTGRVQPRGSHTALTRAAGPGQGTWHSTSPRPGWGHSEPHLGTRTNRHRHATGCDLLGPRGGNIHEQAGDTCIGSSHSMSCFAGQDIHKSLMGSQLWLIFKAELGLISSQDWPGLSQHSWNEAVGRQGPVTAWYR